MAGPSIPRVNLDTAVTWTPDDPRWEREGIAAAKKLIANFPRAHEGTLVTWLQKSLHRKYDREQNIDAVPTRAWCIEILDKAREAGSQDNRIESLKHTIINQIWKGKRPNMKMRDPNWVRGQLSKNSGSYMQKMTGDEMRKEPTLSGYRTVKVHPWTFEEVVAALESISNDEEQALPARKRGVFGKAKDFLFGESASRQYLDLFTDHRGQ